MRRGIKGLLLGITIGLIGGLFGLLPYGISFERDVGLDWLFNNRSAIESPAEPVVIAIDGFTGDKLGIPDLPREWPRSIHGTLVDALVKRGVSTIVFDLYFSKSISLEEDRVFGEAMERSDRVVLVQELIYKGRPVANKTGQFQGEAVIEELLEPAPVLKQAARGIGPFPVPISKTSVYEYWVFKSSVQDVATMPAVALQVYALKVHDEFMRLLEDSGVTSSFPVPASASSISSVAELRAFMDGLRSTVAKNPQLARNLERGLHQPRDAKGTADTRRLLKSLVSLYSGNEMRFLNFYGPPGSIETISYQSIIQDHQAGKDVSGTLEGRVAFVGYSDFYDPNQPDRFRTVFTSRQGFDLSGVEIAATAFANLLHDQSLRPPNALTLLGILFFFGIAFAVLAYATPAVYGVPASVMLAAGYVYYAQFRFDESYLWLPLATPILVQFPLALFIGLMAQYFGQRHKVRHISEAISIYVPEDVSRALISEDLSPEDTNQVSFSTCLATDMEGFTTISENMEPGKLAEFLNDYFDTLARPMKENNVTVTDFRADAIMCAWTGEESDIEVRRKPILASLQAAEALEEFRDRHEAFDSSLRIGMEMGSVYIGHSGGGGNFGYRVVGDCANTASRIEGMNKFLGTQILAAESVVEGFDEFLTRPVGQYVFVGKTTPLSIVEVLSMKSDATRRQQELCERFAAAIELFMRQDWKAAAENFKSITDSFADERPSRFFLAQCMQRIEAAPVSDSPWVIHMEAK